MMTERTCRICHNSKPISEFRIQTVRKKRKDGTYHVWVGPRHACIPCEALPRGKAQHERRKAEGNFYWRRRSPEQRIAERRRECERAGRPYRSRAEITTAARAKREAVARAKQERARGRPGMSQEKWIERLRTELPEMYDPSTKPGTLVWRARYHLDPKFKAREVARAAKRHSREHGGTYIDDGSLTPPVVQSLFASATACPYCTGALTPRRKTLDHIVPRKQGGWHSVRNAVVCCHNCNSSKCDLMPDEWLARLAPERRQSVRRLWERVMGTSPQQGFLCA